jgi:hypothetical protein
MGDLLRFNRDEVDLWAREEGERRRVQNEKVGNRPLREITRRDVERFQSSLRDKKTKRQNPRKGATVNRYIYLLSAIFSRAALDEVVEDAVNKLAEPRGSVIRFKRKAG